LSCDIQLVLDDIISIEFFDIFYRRLHEFLRLCKFWRLDHFEVFLGFTYLLIKLGNLYCFLLIILFYSAFPGLWSTIIYIIIITSVWFHEFAINFRFCSGWGDIKPLMKFNIEPLWITYLLQQYRGFLFIKLSRYPLFKASFTFWKHQLRVTNYILKFSIFHNGSS
jgi:hypothetical protein